MAEQRGSGWTRADVLVAVVTGLLLIFLVPVLFAKPREVSIRRVCAANLGQIGKAMLLYAGDHEGNLPRTGGPSSIWGGLPTSGWTALSRRAAFGLAADDSGGIASISSSFYLLVKYYRIPPRVFVCRGDHGATEFRLYTEEGMRPQVDLIDAWDFGPTDEAWRHCSYAYHIPFGLYSLNTSLDPNLAVAADRNPWIAYPAADASIWPNWRPDVPIFPGSMPGTSGQARNGNSISHRKDGQNVLFLDGRVSFETRSYCGVDKDNIYTPSRFPTSADVYGISFVCSPTLSPMNRKDSLLVHDPCVFSSSPTTKKR